MTKPRFRVLAARVENWRRVRLVELKTGERPGLLVIAGKNGCGKTSFIHGMYHTLSGAKGTGPDTIRTGAEKAKAEVELECIIDDQTVGRLRVRRTITKKTNILSIKVLEGNLERKAGGQQDWLDAIISRVALDPSGFAAKTPQEMLEDIEGILGPDAAAELRDNQVAYKEAYDQRRDLKRVLERAAAHKQEIDQPAEDQTRNLLDAKELLKALSDAHDAHMERKSRIQAAIEATKELDRFKEQDTASIRRRETEIRALELQLKDARAEMHRDSAKDSADRERLHDAIMAEQKAIDLLPALDPIAECEEALASAEATNKKAKDAREWDLRLGNTIKAMDAWDEAKKLCASLLEDKAKIFEAADLPIEGLGFDDRGLLVKGQPFSQASDAEKLRVALAVGFAMAPALKLVMLRHGAFMDADSMAHLSEFAEAYGFDVLCERPVEAGELLIEDGVSK